MNATVYHDIRGNDIFLCIANPDPMAVGEVNMQVARECSRKAYSVERQIDPANCTPDSIRSLVAEMERESGLDLEISEIMSQEMGL